MSNDISEGKKTGGGGVAAQRKESSVELQKMMDSLVLVKCLGGRELRGILRGFDDLVNLVLDDSEEYLRGELESIFAIRFCNITLSHAVTYMIYYKMLKRKLPQQRHENLVVLLLEEHKCP
jgi:small nuclear ribonucleoprotein (snRNP)-like protein